MMAKITGDGGITSQSGYKIHDFSGDVKAERLSVSLGADFASNLNVLGELTVGLSNSTLSQEQLTIRDFTAVTDPDISGLTAGTASGSLIEAQSFAHLVCLIRDNDANDSFYIMSGGGNHNTDLTADTVVLRATCAGVVSIPAHPTTASAATCHMDTAGRLFRSTSSIKYKRNVEPLIDSDWIYRIMPVTFRTLEDDEVYIGFIAEDIAGQAPAAAITDEEGIVENYDERAIIAALVKEVKQLREEVDQLKAPTGE